MASASELKEMVRRDVMCRSPILFFTGNGADCAIVAEVDGEVNVVLRANQTEQPSFILQPLFAVVAIDTAESLSGMKLEEKIEEFTHSA